MFQITCSVRTLVEFVYLCGDLDRPFLDHQRALDGARIHRKLQNTSTEHYDAEVYLKHTTLIDDISFEVEGRADGIIHRGDSIVIDEIKTTYLPYDEITEDLKEVHWAQAKCYAYFYCLQENLSNIIVQLTYYQMEEKRIKRFEKTFSEVSLQQFYQELLTQYLKWANMKKHHKQSSKDSIQALRFPFPSYRKGQRELAIASYKTILDHKILFAQAPTGIGKTISTLFPTIKALGENRADRIFYLSAKTITQNVAVDALNHMRKQGLHLKSIVISAKEKCCLMDEKNCDPEICPYAKGYYDRLHDVMYHLLNQHDHFHLSLLQDYGRKYQLCPFELSLDLSFYCDIIICDYNYVFDPQVYLKRFFQDQQERIVLLVDEAHNLVDRARMMYSKTISRNNILVAKQSIIQNHDQLKKALSQLIQIMEDLKQEAKQEFYTMHEISISFLHTINLVITLGEQYIKEVKLEPDDNFESFYYELLAFQKIQELADDHFIYILHQTQDDLIYELYCLDPSSSLKCRMKEVTSTILFSATLSPVAYFETLITGNCENRKLLLSSPFPKHHLSISLHNQISTRYKDRINSAKEIVELIFSSVSMKKGNYMVFLPSYQYLNLLSELFEKTYPQIHCMKQESGMSEQAKQAFLKSFEETKNETLVGFCVLGGMYGEGIDLQQDALIGCIIIGVGLPQINEHQELLKEYFEEHLQMGFAYAYIYPGINKVLQACGRVIRSETDKGILLLIDDRYTLPAWKQLLPAHYQHYQIIHSAYELMKQLHLFWSSIENQS